MHPAPPPAEAYAVFAQERTTLMGQQLASPWAPLGLMPDTTLRESRFAKDVSRLLTAAPAFGKSQRINSTRAAGRPRVDIALVPLSKLQYSASLDTLAFMLDHVYLTKLEALSWFEQKNLQHSGASVYSAIYKPPSMGDFMFAFTDLKAVTTKFAQAKRDLADSPDNLLALYNNLSELQDTPLAYYALSDFADGDVAWRPLHVARHGTRIEKIVGIPLESSAALNLTNIEDRLTALPACVFTALAAAPEAQIISPYAFPVPCWRLDLTASVPQQPQEETSKNTGTPEAQDKNKGSQSTPPSQGASGVSLGTSHSMRPQTIARFFRRQCTGVPSGTSPRALNAFKHRLHLYSGHIEPEEIGDNGTPPTKDPAKDNGPKL